MVTFSIVSFAFIRCKYQITDTFPTYFHSLSVLNLIQVVEPDKFTLTKGTGIENGLFSLALGCWPVMIQPFGGRQGWWVLPNGAPFSSLATGSLSHMHKECIHLNDLSTLTEWKLEGRVPGCTWSPWIFPSSSAPGSKVNFAINILLSISQERPTLTHSMRILLAKIGYYSE